MITHAIGGVIRPRVAVVRPVAADTRLDEAFALRRCAMYRKAFRGTAISYPADALRFEAVAVWAREHGVAIDVTSTDDLDRVRLAGIDASHVVMHCHGPVPVAIGRAGFSRFVVDSREQIAMLADNPLARTQPVVLDVARSDELDAEVVAHRRLNLVGLHCRSGDTTNEATLTEGVVSAIARMSWIRRKHDVLLSRLSLSDIAVPGGDGDPRSLRRIAGVIDQAVEDGCIRFRYPRPALTVSPHRLALLPPQAHLG